ncbi:MAG: hypothetical protein JWR02_2313 [Mucilaginibacter sp.]|nr:hypothetical protein [Mucilaginibacter sp.]
MAKPVVKISVRNGLTFDGFKKAVFDIERLTDIYDFEESANPDFIVFGPYGNDIPPKGNYTRIGYFCENIKPDMSICEWAFGVPREEEVKHPKYKRIQWHGQDPQLLIKQPGYDPEKILASKTKFCNFLYSHRVPYREAFFKQLSKYKKVDAPGKSMNNMESIDKAYPRDIWQRKRQFLSEYKFTIAFESYIYPGYQTEKLYDPMQVNSMPVYCGDPQVNEIFNTKSFINAADYINTESAWTKWLEKHCQMDFEDARPQYYHNPLHRVERKAKAVGRNLKMKLQFNNLNFTPLIERIIELDNDRDKFLEVLQRPWLNHNKILLTASAKGRWEEIFNGKN